MTGFDLSTITLPTPDDATVSFADFRGRRSVLLLANQHTGKAVRQLAADLRQAPETADVPVIQVAHLVGVPRLIRRLATKDIKHAYATQRDELRAALVAKGRPATDVATLFGFGLDWNGEVTTSLGYSADDTEPLVVVVDENCRVVATGHGLGTLRGLGVAGAPAGARHRAATNGNGAASADAAQQIQGN